MMIYKYFLFSTLFIISIAAIGELDPQGSNVCFKNVLKNVTTQVRYTYPIEVTTYKFCARFPFSCKSKKTEFRVGLRPENRTVQNKVAYCCDGYLQEGEKCKPNCPKNCLHGECIAPGVCDCQLGFGGESCATPGPPHKFGLNFEYDCTCLTKPHCNKNYLDCSCTAGKISSDCRNICKCKSSICGPGLIGKNCETPCPNGTFGIMCIGTCSCNETNTVSCSKETGDCECKPSFYGVYCEHHCKGKVECESPYNCKCILEKIEPTETTLTPGSWAPKGNDGNNHGLIFSLIGLLIVTISTFMIVIYKYKMKANKLKRNLQDVFVRYSNGSNNDQFDNPVYSYSNASTNLASNFNGSNQYGGSPYNGSSYTGGSTFGGPSIIQSTTLPHRPRINPIDSTSTVPRKPRHGYLNELSLLPNDPFLMHKNALADATNPNMVKRDGTLNSNIYTTIDEVKTIKDEYKNEFGNNFKQKFDDDFGSADDIKSTGEQKQAFKIEEDNDSVDYQFDKVFKKNDLINNPLNDQIIGLHYDQPNKLSTFNKQPTPTYDKLPTYEIPKPINQSINESNKDSTKDLKDEKSEINSTAHYDTLTSNRSYYQTLEK